MRQREDTGQKRLGEQQEGEDRVRFSGRLDVDSFIARLCGSRGDPFANHKNMISEYFVNKSLREKSDREKRKKRKIRA